MSCRKDKWPHGGSMPFIRTLKKEVFMERWKLEDRIEKIVNGTEVDKSGLREDILDLIDELIDKAHFGLGKE